MSALPAWTTSPSATMLMYSEYMQHINTINKMASSSQEKRIVGLVERCKCLSKVRTARLITEILWCKTPNDVINHLVFVTKN